MSCTPGNFSFSSVPGTRARTACSRAFETRAAVSRRQHVAVCCATMAEAAKKGVTFEETALGAFCVAMVCQC
jgi:hypothetical protein